MGTMERGETKITHTLKTLPQIFAEDTYDTTPPGHQDTNQESKVCL